MRIFVSGSKNGNNDISDHHDNDGVFSRIIRRGRVHSGQEIFSSAPKENLDAIPDKKERFPGAHVIGGMIVSLALLMFAGAAAIAVLDGIKNYFDFLKFFARFIIMLYCMEIYDIIFFDWFLLCHSNFFPHFYPELKGIVGPHMFGYNKKANMIHFVVYIPACAVAAGVCSIF